MDLNELALNTDKMLGMNLVQRLKFFEYVVKYGLPTGKIEFFYTRLVKFIEPVKTLVTLPDMAAFRNYCKLFYAALLFYKELKEKAPFFFFKFEGYLVIKRITAFCLIKSKMNSYARRQEKFKIKSRNYTELIKKGGVQAEGSLEGWKNTDDFCLLKGMMLCGFDDWENLIREPKLWDEEGKKGLTKQTVWKYLFEKIEQKLAPVEDQTEVEKFLKEYLKIRANRLVEMLLEEENRRSAD